MLFPKTKINPDPKFRKKKLPYYSLLRGFYNPFIAILLLRLLSESLFI